MNRYRSLRRALRRRLMQCVALVACAAAPVVAHAQAEITAKPANLVGLWGDQGDGTFVNPVLPGDYSDLDAIQVGETYYAISSSFQYEPGMIVMRSKDLVSWEIAGHAVPDVLQIGPEMNWDVMNRYGRGVWAGAIRHHDGKFWVYFGTPDEGFFVTSAADVAGPWEPLAPVLKAKGWDDCCPFWDDDGQGYFVATNFSDGYKIHLFKLSADNKSLAPGFDKMLYSSKGSEANKLYKIKGIYYHFFSENRGEGRVVMMRRATSLDGPWETRQLNHVSAKLDKNPNQGGLVETPAGDWWFVTHQGTGDWEGRAMCLLPVTWTDGWPVIGKPGADGIGNMVWQAKKPIAGVPVVLPQADEEFDGKAVGVQWEWNYKPRPGKWSLAERPGFLRLHAFKPLKAGDLLKAGNTLTQRSMRTNQNDATVKLDLGGMVDGQQAGLTHFGRSYSALGVAQAGDARTIVFNDKGKLTPGPAVAGNDVWIKSTWGFDGASRYAYSTDGKTFTPFGTPYQLAWGSYRGDRLGIYNYNNKSDAGHVDVDWFHYAYEKPKGAAN